MSVVVPVNCVNKQKSIHQEKKGKKRTHQGGKKKNPSRKVRLLTVYANIHIYTHAHVIMSTLT